MRHLAAVSGTKVKISKVGHGDLDNDPKDIISCKQLSIVLSDFHA